MGRIGLWGSGLLICGWLGFTGDAQAQKAKPRQRADCDAILRTDDGPKTLLAVRAANCWIDQGKHATAARILQKQLEAMEKENQEGGRAAVENKLEMVLAHVAAFDVHTEAGAEIVADGDVLGQHPETNPLFLEPGAHVIVARKGKNRELKKIEAVAGSFTPLEFKLPVHAASPPVAPFVSPSVPDKPKVSSKWTTARISALVIEGGLGLAGLGLGIGFAVAAEGDERERARIANGLPLPENQCWVTPNLPECPKIGTLVHERDVAKSVAAAGFVLGGISLAAVVATLVWPSKTNARAPARGTAVATITPLQGGASIGIAGAF